MKTTKDAIRDLKRALKKLEDPQGRLARKNGRARVFGAIRALENTIDATFPLLEKTPPQSHNTLLWASENKDEVEFKKDLVEIAPVFWNPTEIQAWATWWFDREGLPARVVYVNPDNGGSMIWHTTSLEVPGHDSIPTQWRWAHFVAGIAQVILRNRNKKRTGRAKVKLMYEIARTWEGGPWRDALLPPFDPADDLPPTLKLIG